MCVGCIFFSTDESLHQAGVYSVALSGNLANAAIRVYCAADGSLVTGDGLSLPLFSGSTHRCHRNSIQQRCVQLR
jgi:hypothetical protein